MPEVRRDTNRLSHGVTSLTYVGDVETEVSATTPGAHTIGIGIVGAVAAVFGTGIMRVAGAAAVGYAVGMSRR